MILFKGGASEPSDTLLPGKAGDTVAVRRTLASTICRITDPTQVSRPRQLRDVSAVMRFRPAHQSMINRRFDDRASCPARKSPKHALARKPRIHSPASGNGGHESGTNRNNGSGFGGVVALMIISAFLWFCGVTIYKVFAYSDVQGALDKASLVIECAMSPTCTQIPQSKH